ncbi:hypothetical protein ACWDZ4_31040 [Streptomyces sp. NPDC003016]
MRNGPGRTRSTAATPDGKRSVTLSLTTRLGESTTPQLLAQLRDVQEDFVCGLLRR